MLILFNVITIFTANIIIICIIVISVDIVIIITNIKSYRRDSFIHSRCILFILELGLNQMRLTLLMLGTKYSGFEGWYHAFWLRACIIVPELISST